MSTRRQSRPLSSFLLRVVQRHEERVVLVYELVDLRSGRVYAFASLAALARHVAAQHQPPVATPDPPSGARKRK